MDERQLHYLSYQLVMPDSCCAVGCTSRKRKGDGISFYRMPFGRTNEKEKRRRELWIAAVKRDKWPESQIDNARICSLHFVSGQKSDDPQSPDYIPSIFAFKKDKPNENFKKIERFERQKARQVRLSMMETTSSSNLKSNDDCHLEEVTTNQIYFEKETQTSYSQENDELNRKIQECNSVKENLEKPKESIKRQDEVIQNQSIQISYWKNKTEYDFDAIKQSPNELKFMTGLSNKNIFYWVLSLLGDSVPQLKKSFSLENHLLLVLMKLRLGSSNRDLSHRFNIGEEYVSRIYRQWLPILSAKLKFLIIWPSKSALRKNLPQCFRHYKNCVCIIDCTEIFIERANNLEARAITWSNYKHTNTIKFLIGISPAGAVTFLSHGWGGRVSDKEITIKSNFLDYLEHGETVLADRGFSIKDELAAKGASLCIPSFTRGKSQLPAVEVEESRKIANVRIHVERVIGRLKNFKILSSIIPVVQADLMNDVMIAVSALVNLNASVVVRRK